jgi:tetratricopeptide (TPR) repeat protein
LAFEAPVLEDTDEALQQVYDFLNRGGSAAALARGLERAWETGDDYYQLRALFGEERYARSAHIVEDLTGDSAEDLLLFLTHANSHIIEVLKCSAGQYTVAYSESWGLDEFAYVEEYSVRDVNGNGTNELLLDVFGGHGAYHFEGMDVYEWNGTTLVRVLETPGLNVKVSVEIVDVDQDGAGEFRVTLGPPHGCPATDPPYWLPYRGEIHTFGWNGVEYVEVGFELAPPEYRFLMVYAADEAALAGDYEKAVAYYQAAIFDVSLKPASSDLWSYLERNGCLIGFDTPEPSPTPDAVERPNLEAYSRYRLLLTHVLRGDLNSARVVYDELQKRFPSGTAGSAYAQMAAVLWQEYDVNGELGEACAKARQYAGEHPAEILSPLGTESYGLAGTDYLPEDICPAS